MKGRVPGLAAYASGAKHRDVQATIAETAPLIGELVQTGAQPGVWRSA